MLVNILKIEIQEIISINKEIYKRNNDKLNTIIKNEISYFDFYFEYIREIKGYVNAYKETIEKTIEKRKMKILININFSAISMFLRINTIKA